MVPGCLRLVAQLEVAHTTRTQRALDDNIAEEFDVHVVDYYIPLDSLYRMQLPLKVKLARVISTLAPTRNSWLVNT